MSKTVGMVSVCRNRRRAVDRLAFCTWCGAPMVEGIAVIDGRFLRNALICQPCDRLGVRCTCRR